MPSFANITDALSYLSLHRTYLHRSKSGTIFLRPKPPESFSKDTTTAILKFFVHHRDEDLKNCNEYIQEKYNKVNHPVSIKNWEKSERPREMLLANGAENMTNAQLLTILLGMGRPGVSALTMAQNLLKQYHTFREMAEAPIQELCKTDGIGLAKSAQIKAALEIGKRLGKERIDRKVRLNQPELVLTYVAEQIGLELQDSKKEYLYVVLLDNKMKPIKTFFSTLGSIDTNIVDISDIIRRIAQFGATSIILVHNHPSGETSPSQEDEETTRRVAKACSLVGVKLIDHVIVGANPEDYFSFQKKGLL